MSGTSQSLNHTQSRYPSAQNVQSPATPGSTESTGNVVADTFHMLINFFTADPNKQKVLASTQDHLDIYDIRDDLVLLKNGDVALVIETTAVNFQLLSAYEQDIKINAFKDLINSLTYEVQIVIHTEPIDMRRYLNYLEENYHALTNPHLKKQMRIYIDFVKDLVVQNNILQKRFFVVIPHRSGILTAEQLNPFQKAIDVILGRKRFTELKDADKIIEKANIALIPKRDALMKLLAAMGIGSKQLTTQELINLFYSYYNPVSNF
ncbi:MAG: hypothetical protein KatS3mg084_0063 [Candidatus Dojkabacteria bacterium]|jgi:hypothetical protein|nr:MAG: hypothetical protein KatS3mg084_0063 [Candidatus Dojkabacteria bacterium]